MANKIYRKSVHHTIVLSKKILQKNPRLKNKIKTILETQIQPKETKSKYDKWLSKNFPDFIDQASLVRQLAKLRYLPLISIVLPVYNTKLSFLRDCLDSVISQIYPNWELCIVDDASPKKEVRQEILKYAKYDKRIKYQFLTKNHHIADATNEAIKMAKGSYVSLLDHDDILWPNALLEVVKALNKNEQLEFIYSDEDKITNNRHNHLGPFFKPDWNPDFLHSVNYITHFTTIHKSVLDKVGGFNGKYNGAQDWDLFLRITSLTDKIYHIPKIIYSWRIHNQSTAKSTNAKPYVVEAQRNVLLDDLKRKGYKEKDVELYQNKKHKGYWNVDYKLITKPLISIIIPSKDQYKVVKRCVESIYTKTTYQNFEIILVDTGSTDKKVLRWYKKLIKQHSNFKLINWPETPFSYSRSCNRGAKEASGELLLMLNNDTEVLIPNWLQLMAGDALRPKIGAVGCLLFYPDGYHIQHAGVGIGLGGVAANSFSMMTLDQPMTQTQHLMINTKHNMTAVTAACMMIRKDVFNEVDGFSEEFRITYNDVDLCLKLYKKGYHNLYNPNVRLLHHESISVGRPKDNKKRDTTEFQKAKKIFLERWQEFINHDPNINSNLSKDNAFYDI